MTIKVNLATVLNKIDLLKQNATPQEAADISVLRRIESALRYEDENIQHFLADIRGQLTKPNSNINKILNENYAQLKAKLVACATTLRSEVAFMNSDMMKKNVTKLAEEVEEISKLVPTLDNTVDSGWSDDHLYSLCDRLGGQYIRFSQSDLPTMGGEMEAGDNKVKKTSGNCGGLVMEWAEQAIAEGTPKFPLASTVPALDKQETQHIHRKKSYTRVRPVAGTAVFNMNLPDEIARLATSTSPYYIIIGQDLGAEHGYKHALGLRSNGGIIEVYDPNYGNFFFPDAKSAGTWLASLLHYYQTTDFPSDKIRFYKHNNTADKANAYPDYAELEKLAIKSHTRNGYNMLLTELWSQLFYVTEYSAILNPTKMVDIVLDTIRYSFPYFKEKERKDIKAFLQSCVDANVNANDKADVHKRGYLFFAGDAAVTFKDEIKKNQANKEKVTNFITKLNAIPLNSPSPTTELALEEYRKKEKELTAEAYTAQLTINELIADINNHKKLNNYSPAQLKEKQEQINALEKLVLTNTRLRTNLQNRQIEGKLIAAAAGKTSAPYGAQELAAELSEVEALRPTLNNIDEFEVIINELNTLIATVVSPDLQNAQVSPKQASQRIAAHLDIRLQYDAIAISLGDLSKYHLSCNNINDMQDTLYRKTVLTSLESAKNKVEQLKAEIDSKAENHQVHAIFSEAKAITPNLAAKLKSLEKRMTDNIDDLAGPFNLLSHNSANSILRYLAETLSKVESQNVTATIIKSQLQAAFNTRAAIINAIDPNNPEADISRKIVLNEMQKLIPSIKSVGDFTMNAYQQAFDEHISFATLPTDIITLVEKVRDTVSGEDTKEASKLAVTTSLLKRLQTIHTHFINGSYNYSATPGRVCAQHMLVELGARSIATTEATLSADDVDFEKICAAIESKTLRHSAKAKEEMEAKAAAEAAAQAPATKQAEAAKPKVVTPMSQAQLSDLHKIDVPLSAPANASFFERHPRVKNALIGVGIAFVGLAIASAIIVALVLTSGIAAGPLLAFAALAIKTLTFWGAVGALVGTVASVFALSAATGALATKTKESTKQDNVVELKDINTNSYSSILHNLPAASVARQANNPQALEVNGARQSVMQPGSASNMKAFTKAPEVAPNQSEIVDEQQSPRPQ